MRPTRPKQMTGDRRNSLPSSCTWATGFRDQRLFYNMQGIVSKMKPGAGVYATSALRRHYRLRLLEPPAEASAGPG
jgi:hypothetical protein